MTIDLSVIGKELQPLEYTYTARDTIFYALGIGAGAEPDELKFVYENELQLCQPLGGNSAFSGIVGSGRRGRCGYQPGDATSW